MNEVLKNRIQQRLDELGKSARGASLEVSSNADLIRNILKGKSDQPRIDTLSKIANALETSPEWLTGRSDSSAPLVIRGDARRADVELPGSQQLARDVPVRGTAAGSHLSGAFQLSDNVIDWALRPPALSGVRDLYALYIEGTSMEPEHRPGDLRFVHPGKPPRIGDTVVVQIRSSEHDDMSAMIGHLVKRNNNSVFIGKLNPEAVVELKAKYLVSMHKVMTVNELFGL